MKTSICRNPKLFRTLCFMFLFTDTSYQFMGPYSDEDFYQEQSLVWEDVEVEFLTTVKSSKLHSNDFHVANVTFSRSKTVSYTMHISKSEGLFHPEHLGILPEEAENFKCTYSGTIIENSANSHPKSGLVSLSSCHHEQGFEGLVLLPDNQYYIKPVTSHSGLSLHFVKRSITPGSKPKVSHKAYKVNSEQTPFKPGKIDAVLIPSPEEFKAALAKSTTNSIDALEDEEVTSPDHFQS